MQDLHIAAAHNICFDDACRADHLTIIHAALLSTVCSVLNHVHQARTEAGPNKPFTHCLSRCNLVHCLQFALPVMAVPHVAPAPMTPSAPAATTQSSTAGPAQLAPPAVEWPRMTHAVMRRWLTLIMITSH
jgi:hypothetical protein